MISKRYKTIFTNDEFQKKYADKIVFFKKEKLIKFSDFLNKTIWNNCIQVLKSIPANTIDLIIADFHYNLTKK